MIKQFKIKTDKENHDFQKYEFSIFNSPVYSNK